MRIVARGYYEGRRREVTWEDGRLSGDEVAVAMLELRAEAMGERYFGPPEGGGVYGRPLELAAGFVALARELLLGIRFSGDLEGGGEPTPEGVVF